ncbi:hypothetical protein PPERSA_05230 [Pseudocohnilembus persalinus]|uniref:Uncharacterized protein n=1 Tax=Pseudocohnilembus persalinus TaxID=266149 RepID=A0A0V0QYC3_PSEPJ|nr:hypothetical protein PPERSA_05230 [Pseudocohnilembus persalinus]|eukprot:KRX07066.1 hypothetical protein PPERSA_05230 [Pseudocohnilembus persalinus]
MEDQDGGQLHSDDLYLSPKENRSFMKKICGYKQDSQQENQIQNQNQIQVQNQNQLLQNQQYLNHQFEIPYENFSLGLISNNKNNNKRKESYFTNFTGMEERLITNQSEFNELNYFNQNLGGITNQNNLSQINNNNLNNNNINVNLNQVSGLTQLQQLQFQQNQQLKFEKEVQTEMCQEDLELEGQNLEFKKKYYSQKKDFKERNFKLESKIQHQVDQIKFLINFGKSCGNCKDKLKIYYKQSAINK